MSVEGVSASGSVFIHGIDLEQNASTTGESQITFKNLTNAGTMTGVWIEHDDTPRASDGILLDGCRFLTVVGGHTTGTIANSACKRAIRLKNGSRGNDLHGFKVYIGSEEDYSKSAVEDTSAENRIYGCLRMTQSSANPWPCPLVDAAGLSGSDAYRWDNKVSADNGNTSPTLTVGTSARIQRWATSLTNNRTATLATTRAGGSTPKPPLESGDTFTIVRSAGDTGGPWGLAVTISGGATLKTLSAGQWCTVTHDGTTWVVTQYGTL